MTEDELANRLAKMQVAYDNSLANIEARYKKLYRIGMLIHWASFAMVTAIYWSSAWKS